MEPLENEKKIIAESAAQRQTLARELLTRPLACLAMGLGLGIAAGARLHPALAGPASAAMAGLALLFLAAALALVLRGQRPLWAAMFMLCAGLAAGFARVQPLNAALRIGRTEGIGRARVQAQVVRDEGFRDETGRRGLVLDKALVQDLAGGREEAVPWQGMIRISFATSKEEDPGLGPGDVIRFTGSVRAAERPLNPGEFDYRAYLLGQGITAQAWPRYQTKPEVLERGGASIHRLAWRAGRALSLGLDNCLSPRAAALAKGLVLGDRSGLTKKDNAAFVRAGFPHLLAVSGQNLTLALWLFLLLAGRLFTSRRKQAAFGLTLAVTYALITGMQIPVQRALALFLLVLLARIFDLETDLSTSLAFGAAAILLLQPGALFEASFQLSFAATFSLVTLGVWTSEKLPRAWPLWLKGLLAVTFSAQFAVLPLEAWHFYQLHWPAFIANILVAPLIPAIQTLGLILGVLGNISMGAAKLLGWALEVLLDLMFIISEWFASWRSSTVSVGRPGPWVMLAWGVWILLLLKFEFRKKALLLSLGLAMMSAGLVWKALPPGGHRHKGVTRVWFLAVGQGDSTLVEFEDGRTLLVDGGPAVPDAGAWTVEPALRSLGISSLDCVAASHPHADHVGGLTWVLNQFPVRCFMHPGQPYDSKAWQELLQTARGLGIPETDLSTRGAQRQWCSGKVRALSPDPMTMRKSRNELHDNSLVLMVEDWLLLTGDLQKKGEASLLRQGTVPRARVLKVAHQGSHTSTGARFLEKTGPEACVIFTRLGNRFGHPSREVLGRIRARGARLFRTDLQGCVSLEKKGDEMTWRTFKEAEDKALWQAPGKNSLPSWKNLEKEGF